MTTFWDAFLPQLLATLVGGGVTAAVSILAVRHAFQLEQDAKYDDRVTAAASVLITELAQYAEATHNRRRWASFSMLPGAGPEPPSPSPNSVSAAIEALVIVTRGHERDDAKRISAAWQVIGIDTRSGADAARLLAGAIRDWRTGDAKGRDLEQQIGAAEGVAAAPYDPT